MSNFIYTEKPLDSINEEELKTIMTSWIRTCPKCGSIIEKEKPEEFWHCKYCGWE